MPYVSGAFGVVGPITARLERERFVPVIFLWRHARSCRDPEATEAIWVCSVEITRLGRGGGSV